MNDVEAEDFTPDPINLLESNRSLGYSIEEAIADLIDNSITAEAKEISFILSWNNGKPIFALIDDGKGMTYEELVHSFRLGSSNPLAERDENDLGRFGFGMKTASLSQSRSFIVISKSRNQRIISRSLDLDFLNQLKGRWVLKKLENHELLGYQNSILERGHGTVVLWNNWDRAPKEYDDFISLADNISNYISVCFHRYIEMGVKIYCDDILLESISPIPRDEGAEQQSKISLSKNKDATQTAYVLQHPSNWKEDYESTFSFNSFRLFEGFERQQGIYIYRCNRLLTPNGGWLGVLKMGNSAKLARVVIDYPNSADSLWSLDITKTNAKIPYEFKSEIESFVKKTKIASIKKIVRGISKAKESIVSFNNAYIWKENKHKETKGLSYKINQNHPFFVSIVNEKKVEKKVLNEILELISEQLPIQKIITDNDEDPSQHDKVVPRQKLNSTEILIAKKILEIQMSSSTKRNAIQYLLSIEPYVYYQEQIKKIADEY
jgi:hypothetical protein